MKRILWGLLILVSLVVVGCGAGGKVNDSTSPTTTTPNTTTPNTTTPNTTTPNTTTPNTTTPTVVGVPSAITLANTITTGSLSQGGATTVTAEVRDGAGNLVVDGTLVTFESSAGSITTSAVTVGGKATATFQAGSTGGNVVVTVKCGDAAKTLSFAVDSGTAASIVTQSVTPKTLGVAGSGIEDTAVLSFSVRDTAGNPAPDGTTVNFEIKTGVHGGESLSATSAKTAGGQVTVALQSGSASGTISVVASLTTDSGKIISTVASVTIVSNRPDAQRITLGASILNLAGGVTLGLQSTISAYLGDSSGNVVPDGTPVSFVSECGTIGTSGGFDTTTTFGVASAILQTSSPAPPNLGGIGGIGNPGLCRILALTPGKGTFLDLDGDGEFDEGLDQCTTTLDEPYLDANDNNQYDAGEWFRDVNDDKVFTTDVVDCKKEAMIWTSSNLLISDNIESLALFPTTFELADGESPQLFTFNLSDIQGNALVAGTKVKVTTTKGTLVGLTEFTQPDTTGLGQTQISFALVSDLDPLLGPQPATVTVTVTPPAGDNNNGAEVIASVGGTINLAPEDTSGLPDPGPAPSSGDPANILLDTGTAHIFVQGVGQVEQTTFVVQVVDDSGAPINEASYNNAALNNLRVSFATRPNGGEFVTGEGVDAGGNSQVNDTRASGSMLVRTQKGLVPLNLQAGTLPGNVVLKVEVLVDAAGNLLTTPISASLPLVSISSGPPHTIVLTSAITASVENLVGQGVYRRQGTAIVTDRYGNSVPDSTAINLGLLDSVIAQGATINITGTTVTAPAGAFNSTISRNEIARGIQPNDRVILSGVPAQDKSRHVASAANATLTVQKAYSANYGVKDYFVGASLLGGYISGTTKPGDPTLTTGVTVTKDGLADIYVTYPANVNTINLGCGTVPAFDLRHLPVGSAKVFVTAATSDSAATTINEGKFCFAPIAGFTLELLPATKATGTTSRSITLEDGGDEIPVPFSPLSAFVAVDALGKTDVCADGVLTTEAACDAASTPLNPRSWLARYGICRAPSITVEADCKAAGNTWFKDLTSDFKVKVYFNTFSAAPFVDLDGDGSNDIAWAGAADLDGDGVPDDLDGNGVTDINDTAAIPVDFNGDSITDFYSYPYTFSNGGASTEVIVTGDLIATGDKATITIVSGDGSADLSVAMP